MSKQRIAEIIVSEWKLSHGWTPAQILQEHFAGEQRFCKVASKRMAAAEARILVAGITLDFVRDIANAMKTSMGSIIEIFKDSQIVRFFSKVGWSFKKIWDLMKDGYRTYVDIRKIALEYVSNTKVVRWTTEEFKKLDAFFSNHPYIRRVTGLALAGLLIWLFFHTAYIGDMDFDLDIADVFGAFSGSYSFANFFGGVNGAKWIVAIFFSMAVPFAIPGPNTIHFITAFMYTLIKGLRLRFRKERPTKDEKIPALAV